MSNQSQHHRMLWLHEKLEDKIFSTELDESFNEVDWFSSDQSDQPKNKIQGALRDIIDTIPEQYWEKEDFEGWVVDTMTLKNPEKFNAGMNIEHSTIANCLRGHPNLFDCSSSEFLTSNGRLALRNRVGWKEDAEHSEQSHYDASNVPLLHKDYNVHAESNVTCDKLVY
ncbi:hypothetical protein BT96DRAFT_941629 [Gymnopus androsaceus JB14]|uniref:Uncharacterized protein n=1 Tax=Gymnopus androsaceus JB14 TaxID=1447944 RepID=A0A6A4HFA4_9AGAR|nr:hypothetical protein BT96DRAFT_941629 [Gymnopus androsaceus JB14]